VSQLDYVAKIAYLHANFGWFSLRIVSSFHYHIAGPLGLQGQTISSTFLLREPSILLTSEIFGSESTLRTLHFICSDFLHLTSDASGWFYLACLISRFLLHLVPLNEVLERHVLVGNIIGIHGYYFDFKFV
jgi:hypothetical protein